MRTIVSVATSLDGYMDDCSPVRLRLSSDEDWREVALLRAECDVILVGAGTVRCDNPSLVIRDQTLRAEREVRGMSPDIDKATICSKLDLDPSCDFFTAGGGRKIIFTSDRSQNPELEAVADIVHMEQITARAVVDRLEAMGYHNLMIEGGADVLRMFFAERVPDELRHAVAPVTIGDPAAPHFDLPEGLLPTGRYRAGDTEVYKYRVAKSDDDFLRQAIDESRKSVPCQTAFRVGAVIVTASGRVFKGYTHETAPHNHAEEEAIAKALAAGAALGGSTIYTSMEPCSTRSSKPVSCCEHIIRHGFARVVYASGEPATFVSNTSAAKMRAAGVEYVQLSDLAAQVEEINKHLLR